MYEKLFRAMERMSGRRLAGNVLPGLARSAE